MRFLCFQTHTPTSDIPPNTYYRSPRTSNTHTAAIRLHVLIHMYTSQTPMDTHRQIFPTLEHTDAPNTRHGATSPDDNHPAPPPTETQKDTARVWVSTAYVFQPSPSMWTHHLFVPRTCRNTSAFCQEATWHTPNTSIP